MTDETRTRFLAAIARQIPAERVIEVHLFAAIRQGGAESGVAVIAVERETYPSLQDTRVDLPVDGIGEAEEGVVEPLTVNEVPSLADTSVDLPTTGILASEEPSPYADDDTSDAASADDDAADDDAADDDAADDDAASDAPAALDLPPSRYTVFSARYRHTLKGPDRGKWEVSVTEEADAPLLTIDRVVRGVQQRSGEADDTVRLSGEEFRAALPVAPPAS